MGPHEIKSRSMGPSARVSVSSIVAYIDSSSRRYSFTGRGAHDTAIASKEMRDAYP